MQYPLPPELEAGADDLAEQTATHPDNDPNRSTTTDPLADPADFARTTDPARDRRPVAAPAP